MKPIFPSPRWVIRILVVALSLIALIWAGFNHWTARNRQQARQAYLESGGQFDLASLLPPLPPDEENFAMLPIFVELRDAMAVPSEDRTGDLIQRFESLKPEDVPRHRAMSDTDHLRAIAEASGLHGSFQEMLNAYEASHEEILSALRSGLSRPDVSYSNLRGLPSNQFLYSLSSGANLLLRKVLLGLSFRCSLALEAGRPDLAWESLQLQARIAEYDHSSETMVFHLVGAFATREAAMNLKRILEAGAWDEAAAADFSAHAWNSSASELLLPSIQIELIAFLQVVDLAKSDSDFRKDWFNPTPPAWLLPAIPSGYYDQLGATALRDVTQFQSWLVGEESWSHLADYLRSMTPPKRPGLLGNSSLNEVLHMCSSVLLHEAVVQQQARVALRLEAIRSRTGSYPESLDDWADDTQLDPATGQPFRYQRTHDSYLLYSLGVDGIDDGGKTLPSPKPKSNREDPDWVW
ncbi:hypothetical protein HNR46_003410 [Haloferula luteola]|uniref:Uncharacterized protein n=1 Tax=Haloferula luteola TaxID=595692 RepID=A0A840V7Y2_9BACT|nr:hypothetical protein [Haloferula luteola]MBB5353156.1 hypothetical protein [Haloferula luteola]